MTLPTADEMQELIQLFAVYVAYGIGLGACVWALGYGVWLIKRWLTD